MKTFGFECKNWTGLPFFKHWWRPSKKNEELGVVQVELTEICDVNEFSGFEVVCHKFAYVLIQVFNGECMIPHGPRRKAANSTLQICVSWAIGLTIMNSQ